MAKTLTELFSNLTAVGPSGNQVTNIAPAGTSGIISKNTTPADRTVGGVQFSPAGPDPLPNWLNPVEPTGPYGSYIGLPMIGIADLVGRGTASTPDTPHMKLSTKNHTVANPYGNTSSIRIIG